MKRIILSLLVFATCGLVTAQTLSVADVYVTPGGKASFALSANVGSGEYDSYQFTMTFPATGFSLTGNTTSISSWDGPLSVGSLASGVANASGLSLNGTAIPSGDIILGTVEFEAASTLAEGTYEVAISDFEFISSGTGTPVSDVTFNVIVSNRLILDENSTAIPSPQKTNVLVKRTIKKNVWNTICLPFGMDAATIEEIFGEGTQMAKYNTFTKQSDGSFKLQFVSYAWEDEDWMDANTPYIIKPTKDVDEFSVDAVEISGDYSTLVYSKSVKGKKSTFTGTLSAGYVLPENYLFFSNGKFYYSTGSTLIMGFRGYFYLQEFSPSSSAPTFEIDGETTRIDEINIVDGDGRIYNLNGQHVENPTSKGVYIQNGKKVVMKK